MLARHWENRLKTLFDWKQNRIEGGEGEGEGEGVSGEGGGEGVFGEGEEEELGNAHSLPSTHTYNLQLTLMIK